MGVKLGQLWVWMAVLCYGCVSVGVKIGQQWVWLSGCKRRSDVGGAHRT